MDDQYSLHLTDSSSEPGLKQELVACSPIFEAIFEENTEVIKACLKSVEGSEGCIGMLFDCSFNINDALYWACYYGHVLSVECLLEEGADPQKRPIHPISKYPIHGACYGGLKVLDVITRWVIRLNGGPSVNPRLYICPFLDARDIYYSTALHVATKLKKIEVAEYLLYHGAHPGHLDIYDKIPIQYAEDGTPIFQLLYEYMNIFIYQYKKGKLHKSPGGMEDGPAAGSPNPPEIASSS